MLVPRTRTYMLRRTAGMVVITSSSPLRRVQDAGTSRAKTRVVSRTNLDAHERGSGIVDFDSNTGFVITDPGTGRSTGHVGVPEDVYFGTSYYWVQLDLVRSSTSCNPDAVGAYLVPVIP